MGYFITILSIGILGSFLLFIIGPAVKRWLADCHAFWVCIPEMHVVFRMKNKALIEILICCSDEAKLLRIKESIKGHEEVQKALISRLSVAGFTTNDLRSWLYEDPGGKIKIRFVKDGELVWIGPPWFGNSTHSWSGTPRDTDSPSTYPQHTLYIGEVTWDYTAPNDEDGKRMFNEQWGTDTMDPIQVTPKLVVEAEVENAKKAIFGIESYEEAVQKEILAAWKVAVQGLWYFNYKDLDDKKVDGVTELQVNAQDVLDKYLYGEKGPDGFSPHEYNEKCVAQEIYDNYGVWIKKVMIRDIDPTDDTLREALQKKIRAQTQAAADVEKAKGTRDSKKVIADGAVYEVTKVGKAEADVISMKYNARGEGLKKLCKDLGLSGSDSRILLGAEMTIELAKNSNYTYMAGEPGNVGNWLLAAADNMKGGLEKVKTGEPENVKAGVSEIKDALKKLTKDQLTEIVDAAKNIKGNNNEPSDEQKQSTNNKERSKARKKQKTK